MPWWRICACLLYTSTHEQYAKATGLETLFGALYLSGQNERINALFTGIMEDLNAI